MKSGKRIYHFLFSKLKYLVFVHIFFHEIGCYSRFPHNLELYRGLGLLCHCLPCRPMESNPPGYWPCHMMAVQAAHSMSNALHTAWGS